MLWECGRARTLSLVALLWWFGCLQLLVPLFILAVQSRLLDSSSMSNIVGKRNCAGLNSLYFYWITLDELLWNDLTAWTFEHRVYVLPGVASICATRNGRYHGHKILVARRAICRYWLLLGGSPRQRRIHRIRPGKQMNAVKVIIDCMRINKCLENAQLEVFI
jgi:hypothetical protein